MLNNAADGLQQTTVGVFGTSSQGGFGEKNRGNTFGSGIGLGSSTGVFLHCILYRSRVSAVVFLSIRLAESIKFFYQLITHHSSLLTRDILAKVLMGLSSAGEVKKM